MWSIDHMCKRGTMRLSRSIRHVGSMVFLYLLVVQASGCGYIVSQGPPDSHAQLDNFSCTESNAGPIIDIIWLGLVGVTLATGDVSNYDAARVILASGASLGILGSAAAVGFNKSKRCRAAKRQLAERQAQTRIPRGVVVSPSVDTLSIGERVQLTATAHSSSGHPIPGAVFTWSSSNAAVSSVTGSGLVTGHAIGAATIVARTDTVIGTAHVVIVGRD